VNPHPDPSLPACNGLARLPDTGARSAPVPLAPNAFVSPAIRPSSVVQAPSARIAIVKQERTAMRPEPGGRSMESRVAMFLEDFDGLVESYDEYVETLESENVDADDIETRALWTDIEELFKQLSRHVVALRRGGSASDDEMDELESMMENLNDLYGELGALL
jgi:hypothetical protein